MTKKVLIVDDSQFMRTMLKQIILDISPTVQVDEAGDGNEAIQQYSVNHYDLVLLDIIMPIANGLKVLKEMGKDANVVVISAVGQVSIIDEAKEYGAIGYINKPFDAAQIKTMISTYIS